MKFALVTAVSMTLNAHAAGALKCGVSAGPVVRYLSSKEGISSR